MKKVFKVIIAFLLMISLLPIIPVFATEGDITVYDGTSVSETLQGEGTRAKPYLINSGADLARFIANVYENKDINALINDQNAIETTNALAESREPVLQPTIYIEDYYLITNDIIWSSYVTVDGLTAPGTLWLPIYGNFFNGVFDGGNHTISGLFTDGNSTGGTGIFTRFSGTIRNLTIKDSYFSGNYYVGGFVGLAGSMIAENLTNYAIVHAKTVNDDKTKGSFVGGIIGRAHTGDTTITINNCTNYGTVTNITQGTTGINASAAGPGSLFGGGIIGSAGASVVLRINNCINNGAIMAAHHNAYAGGIIGNTSANGDVIIDKCINTGDVNYGKALIGGIVGQAATGSSTDTTPPITTLIKNCLNTGAIYCPKLVGGIVGRLYAQAKVENCVSIGSVICSTAKNGQYGIVGFKVVELVNSYILAGSAYNEDTVTASTTGGIVKTENELKGIGGVAALGLPVEVWSDGQTNEYLTVSIDSVNTVLAPQLINGASVRFSSPTGIRFTSAIPYNYYNQLVEKYGEVNISFGTVICPTSFLTYTEGNEFTMEALDSATDAALTGKTKYVDINKTQWSNATTALSDGFYCFSGALVNLNSSSYTLNLSAISYIAITVSGITTYYYSDYAELNNSRNIKYVAEAAIADTGAGYTADQLAILNGFVN